jgi:hypothetical protein
MALSLTSCGKSPWSDYVKENNLNPRPIQKPTSDCTLLDADQILWTRGPFVYDGQDATRSEFKLSFREKPDFNFSIDLIMPSMGHGTSPVQVVADSETQFTIKQVYFIMHGLWEVRIKTGNETLCRFQVDLP